MKSIEDMTIAEMKKELSELRKDNDRLRKYKNRPDREVFKYLSIEKKKELFGFTGDNVTGEIVNSDDLKVMNNNFKKFYTSILKIIFPEMKTFNSLNGKYGKYNTTFNDMSDVEFTSVKKLILDICDSMYMCKNEIANMKED